MAGKPKTCRDPHTHKPVERRINNAIVSLREQEKLDPTTYIEQRQTLKSSFTQRWDYSHLTTHEKAQVVHHLVMYLYNFEIHTLDSGIKMGIYVKAYPKAQ